MLRPPLSLAAGLVLIVAGGVVQPTDDLEVLGAALMIIGLLLVLAWGYSFLG